MANPTEVPSASKWCASLFQLVPWLKDLRTIASICIIAFVGFTIYRAYFMKTQQQTQHNTTTVCALPGSNVVVEAPKQTMTANKSHFSIGPFVGVGSRGDAFVGVVALYNF